MQTARVLVVDDEALQRKIATQQLLRLGFVSAAAENAADALQILQSKDFDVVLLDVQMPQTSGLETLDLIQKLDDPPEVIMLTLDNSLESGISAMRAGAYDYLTKPATLATLEITVKKAVEKRRLLRRNSTLQEFVKSKSRQSKNHSEPVNASAAMRRIIEQCDSIAKLNSTVLITGESGTGKDVLANYIHEKSLRAQSAMVSINCGAMPESLFEAEFFGYERGAFTGAVQSKHGLIEVADSSTLFLDEIGEMPLTLQVKLLRFLEGGHFRRVGGTRDLYSDARIIAATNQNLTAAIREQKFRNDLYYRLNVIELHIPPLRERPDDAAVLTQNFIDFFRLQFRKPNLNLSAEAAQKLRNYDFPGNVRELKNIIERASALCSGETVEAEQIFFQDSTNYSPNDNSDDSRHRRRTNDVFDFSNENSIVKLDALERRYLLAVLTFVDGNRERAATLLGISERTLYRRLREYE